MLEPGAGLTSEQVIGEYVLKQFTVKLDGKLQKMNFLGFEREDPAIICYIEIPNVKKFKTLEVKNQVIFDLYDDQSNIVHVTYNGPVKSTRLLRDKPVDVFTFDSK